MRELLAKNLAALTAVIVVGLAAVFSTVHNAPGPQAARPAVPASPPPPATAVVQTAYDRHGCAGCHAIGGQGNPRNPLDGVGQRLAPATIRDWIIAAEGVRSQLSPAVARIKQTYAALPAAELQAMVDYLAGLRESDIK
ncbi:MAG: cytochrome c [Burkholderiales bacterium]|nr:cytochrome c [Burkholderiales bacterium]